MPLMMPEQASAIHLAAGSLDLARSKDTRRVEPFVHSFMEKETKWGGRVEMMSF